VALKQFSKLTLTQCASCGEGVGVAGCKKLVMQLVTELVESGVVDAVCEPATRTADILP